MGCGGWVGKVEGECILVDGCISCVDVVSFVIFLIFFMLRPAPTNENERQ